LTRPDRSEPDGITRLVILGAGGRDFHDFLTVFRDDASTEVVAFTATQIPNIDDRLFPPSLAGGRYPRGIPIRPQSDLEVIIAEHAVDEVVLSYSDLAHVDVMHLASRVLAAGAAFRLLSPTATMLRSRRPVVAVCATRTGTGKSQTSRRLGQLLVASGRRVALVRHPMPYGNLEHMRVQRFASLADIDASHPTIEEREEYEEPVRQGLTVFAGVDYEAILRAAEAEADVILWDGGNNDTPFFEPDLWLTVADPLRAEHGLCFHPGEVNLRRADVVVISKIDAATPEQVGRVVAQVESVNPGARIVRAASPVTLDPGPSLVDARVLVVEDGPTLTHGGMPFGAGTVAARHAGATTLIDPRPYAVGSLASTFAAYPHVGAALPAMGYGDAQLADLAATIEACRPDVVISGTPIDLTRIVSITAPVRHARYDLAEIGRPDLSDVLESFLAHWPL
jgi:predicted GTPase